MERNDEAQRIEREWQQRTRFDENNKNRFKEDHHKVFLDVENYGDSLI